MPNQRTCPKCGAPRPEDLPHGPCPTCALQGALALTLDDSSGAAESPGDQIGPYIIVKKVGEGGHGVVYEAEQTVPLRRRVALKVVKPGMDTAQIITRFEAERQALALMDHPAIAKVFDAGTTDSGRPYFVMELVDGVAITTYCNEHNLSTSDRLALFIQVCHAVQHAHQKGIIHRDLKPSNILVATQDGKPAPKVIDFGIAKATQQPLTEQIIFTSLHHFIGTPAYMSPEQTGEGAAGADTRSDIYALGVLLYELLTGRTPFDQQDFLRAGRDGMGRLIRESEPPKPSTRLGLLGPQDLSRVAQCQRTESPRLIRSVQGDLDWIVMKCLEKDRNRRYEAATGLALDLARHLKHEPVSAAAPSALYQMLKFARRHRFGLGTAAALLAVLMAGVVVSTWQAVRATRAEREQARQRALAEAAEKNSATETKFLQDMLEGVGPAVALGRDTTLLREILDKTATRAGKELQAQPNVEASLLITLGNVYQDIGGYDKALAAQQEALRLRQAFYGPENTRVAESLNNLAGVLQDQGQLAEAEKLFRQALDMRRKVLTNGHPDIAMSLNNLGGCLDSEGKYDEAEKTIREALALRQKLYGSEHVSIASCMQNLGVVLADKGLPREAEPMFRDVETMRRKLLGNLNLDLATTIANLASALYAEGHYTEAEAKFGEALAMQRQLRGRDHKEIASLLYNLSLALQNEGKWPEAERSCRDAIAMERKLLGPEHLDLAASLAGFTSMLQSEGKFAEAEAAVREALIIQRKALGDQSATIAISLINLGEVFRAEGRFAEAETETRRSLAMMQKSIGGTNQYVAYSLATLASVLRDEGQSQIQSQSGSRDASGPLSDKLAEAESVERETLSMRTDKLGPEHPEVAQTLNDLGVILAAQSTNSDPRLKDAESLLRQALAMRQKLLGNQHPDTLDSLNSLAAVLQQSGNLTAAEPLARQCLDLYEKVLPDDWRAFDTRSLLGGILLGGQKYTEAEPLLLSGYDGLKQRLDKIPSGNRHRLKETALQLGQLYTATNQPAEAAKWKKAASEH
jgi:serine/threonine protein kinase/Tfp pilus assembly protein PilF